jgi:hypothetical protein
MAKRVSLFRRIMNKLDQPLTAIDDLRDLAILQQTRVLQTEHQNPLNRFGRKCYSQSDEDGITVEILRRMGHLEGGVFAEFGVGNGMENNTLVLAALGWSGFWVGGEELQFSMNDNPSKKYAYLREWITRVNVLELAKLGLSRIGADRADVVSVDVDGNDIYLVEELLNGGVRPKLFIVEYNAKFFPPIRFQIAYDSAHQWAEDDYFGASLSSFHDLFSSRGYRLVCCNSHSGANAFFVDEQYSNCFADVPAEVSALYAEPRYYLYRHFGHKPSVLSVSKILGLNAPPNV